MKKSKGEVKTIDTNNISNFKDKFLKTKKNILFIIISLLILLSIIGIIIWNIMFVKVVFDTDGGTDIKEVYLLKGTKLENIIEPKKIGSNFVRWVYKDDATIFDIKNTINKDIVLLANYEAMPEEGFVEESLKNIETDAVLVIHSLVELNNENIDKYLKITNEIGDLIALDIKKTKDDKYEINAKEGWTGSFTFFVENLSLTQLEFISLDDIKLGNNTNKINFMIKTKSISDYSYKDNAKVISVDSLSNVKESGKIVVDDTEVKTFTAFNNKQETYLSGDVLLLGADTETLTDDQYYVVTNILADNKLELRGATLTDVYSDLFINYSEQIKFTEDESELLAIEQSIKDEIYNNIDPFLRLSNAYVEGSFETPQVKKLLAGYTEDEIKVIKTQAKVKTPLKEAVFVEIDPTNGFDEETGMSSVKVVVGVNALEVDIGRNATITMDFTITEVFDLGVNLMVTDAKNKGNYSYVSVRVDNSFSVGFNVTLKTETYNEDLTDEIKKFIENPTDKYAWVEEINHTNIMDTTFDYIPILEKTIFQKMVLIYPISIKINIDGIVRAGAEASFTANYTVNSYATAGATNGYTLKEGDKIVYYTNESKKLKTWSHYGSNGQKIELALKGAVGIRGGIKLDVNISALGLNDAYSIGVAFETGIYMKLVGFTKATIDVTKNTKEADIDGGTIFETGIYFSAYFTWNCWPFGLKTTDDILLIDGEFPIYKLSTIGEPLGFVNATNYTEDHPLIISNKEYNLFTDSPYAGNFAIISFNSKTNKYEAIEKKPDIFTISYTCRQVELEGKNESICNPPKEINKNVKLHIAGDKKGTIEILDGAKDGDKFFFIMVGTINNPITGEELDTMSQEIWLQYSAPKEDGVYKITFDAGDGYFLSGEEDENGNQISNTGPNTFEFDVNHGELLIFKKIPQSYTKDGKTYVFEKWSNDFNGEGYFINGDEVIKAIYKEAAAQYTYKFIASHGKFSNGTDTLAKTVEHGNKLDNIEIPTRTNYNFIGWTTDPLGDDINVTFKDGYLYDKDNNVINENTEIFAVWKEKDGISKYNLTFDAGDGWLVDENGNLKQTATYDVKKGEEFYSIPIAIKSPNDAPDYYYTDETFGLTEGFIPSESKTYKANYTKVTRDFDVFISDSTFIKKNGVITYSDDIIANTTEDKWLTGTFNKDMSLPTASLEIDNHTYTTNKYILIVENKKQKPYSINSFASTLKSTYGWSYNTLNVSMYGNSTNSIVYDNNSNIKYGTLISYYYATNGLDLKGISYVECTAVPYFEIS